VAANLYWHCPRPVVFRLTINDQPARLMMLFETESAAFIEDAAKDKTVAAQATD